MEYTKKLIYQSNYWYNDGLKKAKIRDLSGAAASLRKSLQYNRQNIAARNLLGLVYYGMGEVAEALVEWIISKNFKSHENIANYYIRKVQETPGELEKINSAVKKYNQCLGYCEQGGEDLALIQLKKVVAAHPTFLKALQLLALLYMQTEQYPKARQVLRRAHKIDAKNELTIRYIQELSKISKRRAPRAKKEGKAHTVTYKLGNETIIQPAAAGIKDNGPFVTLLNILIGIAVGAAVVWFLIMPTANEMQTRRLNQEVIRYSDQIASKNAEINALKKEIEEYRSASEETKEAQETAKATKSAYEALLLVYEHSQSLRYSKEDTALELLEIKKDALGEQAAALYDSIYENIVPDLCRKKYSSGQRSYRVANYAIALSHFELVTKLDEQYDDGGALYALAQTYEKLGNTEQAEKTYEKLEELYPGYKDNAQKTE